MTDERSFLAQLSTFSPDELARALRHGDADEQYVLRVYFGPEQYASLQRLAMQAPDARGAGAKLGNVIVLHGLMGGELTLFNNDGQERIWVDVLHLMQGQFDRLGLDDTSGVSLRDVRATGIYMKYYAKQLVSLSQEWNVRPFFFDWRRDMRLAADDLARSVDSWFGPTAPVHLVAHSMGGLVARSFIVRHPERWKSMADDKLKQGGRLVMLGTPNYGSFAIPRMLFGRNDALDILVKINVAHLFDRAFFLNIVKAFTGAYQIMPVRAKLPGLNVLYQSGTYTAVAVRQQHLDEAETFQAEIAAAIDPARMAYVAGYNRATFAGVQNPAELATDAGYTVTERGDGTVPHVLGMLDGVKTFFVDEEHVNLPANDRVVRAMTELLQTGDQADQSNLWFGVADKVRGMDADDQLKLQAAEADRRRAREEQALAIASRLQSRGVADPTVVTPEEQALADLLMSHASLSRSLGANPDASDATSALFDDSSADPTPAAPPPVPVSLTIAIRVANIEETAPDALGPPPIDALGVGHYVGVRPSGAEGALDAAISPYWVKAAETPPRVLQQFHDRGILGGALGEPFFVPDPRPGHEGALLAIMGMGPIGRFGVPELALVARELTYSLAHLGKRHLASVLIGASRDNLNKADALHAFILGIQRTLVESAQGSTPRLEKLTLVVRSEAGGKELARALLCEVDVWKPRGFTIQPDIPEELTKQGAASSEDKVREVEPIRIALEIDGDNLRIAAFTDTASVPEREVRLTSNRLLDISRELIDETDPQRRLQLGQYLFLYLFPSDLRGSLTGSAPVVLSCNNAAAQIPWELAALRPEAAAGALADQPYLGLLRGVTRQLRTTLAPPPEPPPPVGRRLRILLVADTCKEHPLPGAQREAEMLLDLFQRVNDKNATPGNHNYIHCVPLIGPARATALNVLLEINTSEPYDVFHYAGHCFYNVQHPEKSGYLFSNGDCLNADDLQRVDRVPKFVFSNACESGVLPSRADRATKELAPAFAEAMFARGVANFLCTAWPISDEDGCRFAVELYSALLGLHAPPDVMWSAMRSARKAIVGAAIAGHTWGAYQHYGSPYFQLLR
jgi:pimeloyl-ACP methyl ester carboxylesterase